MGGSGRNPRHRSWSRTARAVAAHPPARATPSQRRRRRPGWPLALARTRASSRWPSAGAAWACAARALARQRLPAVAGGRRGLRRTAAPRQRRGPLGLFRRPRTGRGAGQGPQAGGDCPDLAPKRYHLDVGHPAVRAAVAAPVRCLRVAAGGRWACRANDRAGRMPRAARRCSGMRAHPACTASRHPGTHGPCGRSTSARVRSLD